MKSFLTCLQESGRLITVTALLIGTFCFAMFQGGFVSWFVFFTVSPFLLYSLLLAFVPLHFTQIRRDITPSKIERGEDAVVKVTFRNSTRFPIVFLTVQDLVGTVKVLKEGQRSQLFLVGFKRDFEWTYELSDLARGEHQFLGLEFVVTDFFGWTMRKKVVKHSQTLLVYPKVTPMKTASLRMQYDQGTVASPYSILKDTTIATGVREYEPGDRFSWIHWKSFAKNGELRTKEFEDRQSQSIFVCLDRSTQPKFEEAVELTASILQSMVKKRSDIVFLSAGETRLLYPAIRTESQLQKVMQHLAVVGCDSQHSIEAILKPEQKLLQRSVLVIVTSELNEQLRAFLMSSSKFSRTVICFVVVDEEQLIEGQQHTYANNKVIHVTTEMFPVAFAEVIKP